MLVCARELPPANCRGCTGCLTVILLEDVPLPEGVSDPSGFSHADATSAASEINKTANNDLEDVRKVISAFPPS